MRRFRLLMLVIATAGLLVTPSSPAQAAVEDFTAVVSGEAENTQPLSPTDPTTHDGEFAAVAIELEIRTDDGFAQGRVAQPMNHGVRYTVTETIAQGRGEIHALAEDRDFRGRGIEWRRDPGDIALACIEARIREGGRFERVGNVVVGQIPIDVRVVRDPQFPPDPLGTNDDCIGGTEELHEEFCAQITLTATPTSLNRFDVEGTVSHPCVVPAP